MPAPLVIRILPERLAVARLDARQDVPAWALAGAAFAGVVRRGDELSIVCVEDQVPADVPSWRGLRALEVQGPLAFDLTGVLASIAVPLADAGVWIFALATYDTDVVLVKDEQLGDATAALTGAGHDVSRLS